MISLGSDESTIGSLSTDFADPPRQPDPTEPARSVLHLLDGLMTTGATFEITLRMTLTQDAAPRLDPPAATASEPVRVTVRGRADEPVRIPVRGLPAAAVTNAARATAVVAEADVTDADVADSSLVDAVVTDAAPAGPVAAPVPTANPVLDVDAVGDAPDDALCHGRPSAAPPPPPRSLATGPDVAPTALALDGKLVYVRPGSRVPALVNGWGHVKVRRGEFALVVGANGSGKTTLLRLMRGEIAPTRGTVYAAAVDIARLLPGGTPLPAFLTVAEIIGLRRSLLGGRRRTPVEAAADVERAARLAGVEPAWRSMLPTQLSSGGQSRVALAMNLNPMPGIILADEPDANLDPQAAADLAARLRGLADTGVTVVAVTHRPEVMLGHADRVIALRAGRIVDVFKNCRAGDRAQLRARVADLYGLSTKG